jgi:hypothetical protein
MEGDRVMVTKRRGLLGLIATGLAALLFPAKSASADGHTPVSVDDLSVLEAVPE